MKIYVLLLPLFIEAVPKVIEEPWRAHPCSQCESRKQYDDRLITTVQASVVALPLVSAALPLLVTHDIKKVLPLGALFAYATYKGIEPLALWYIEHGTYMDRDYSCPFTRNCMYYRPSKDKTR